MISFPRNSEPFLSLVTPNPSDPTHESHISVPSISMPSVSSVSVPGVNGGSAASDHVASPPVSSQGFEPAGERSGVNEEQEPVPAFIPTGHDPFETMHGPEVTMENADVQRYFYKAPAYRSVFDRRDANGEGDHETVGVLYEVPTFVESPSELSVLEQGQMLSSDDPGRSSIGVTNVYQETSPGSFESESVRDIGSNPVHIPNELQISPNKSLVQFPAASSEPSTQQLEADPVPQLPAEPAADPRTQPIAPFPVESMPQQPVPDPQPVIEFPSASPNVIAFPSRVAPVYPAVPPTEPDIQLPFVPPAPQMPALQPAAVSPTVLPALEVATPVPVQVQTSGSPVLVPTISEEASKSFEIPFDPAASPVTVTQETDWLEVRWPWKYLLAFLAAAWIVPETFTALIAPRLPTQAAFNASLVLQLFGYVLAGGVAARIVRIRFNGDWSVFGIRRDKASLDEVLWGAGFGLVLIAAFVPIGLLLNGGRFGLDRMVRVIVGETTPIGLLLAGIMIVVGAPFIEEIFFRSMLFAKFHARFGMWTAIIGTTVVFVMAHGALIIIPLLMLGFGLAWKRQNHRLWYTIGAHAAWNLVVMCMGAYLVLGPPATVVPDDGTFSMRHQLTWERVHRAEQTGPGGSIDFALQDSRGSLIAVGRQSIPAMNPDVVLPTVLQSMSEIEGEGASSEANAPEKSARVMSGFPVVWEQRGRGHDEDLGDFQINTVAALHNGSGTVYVFSMVCPLKDCAHAGEEFEDVLDSFQLLTK